MAAWTCARCDQSNGDDYDICWSCGTAYDGAPAGPDFVRDDVPVAAPPPRTLSCLRFSQPMTSLGLQRFHVGSQAAPFLLGNVGELLVKREGFELFGCGVCGKVELFLPLDELQRARA